MSCIQDTCLFSPILSLVRQKFVSIPQHCLYKFCFFMQYCQSKWFCHSRPANSLSFIFPRHGVLFRSAVMPFMRNTPLLFFFPCPVILFFPAESYSGQFSYKFQYLFLFHSVVCLVFVSGLVFPCITGWFPGHILYFIIAYYSILVPCIPCRPHALMLLLILSGILFWTVILVMQVLPGVCGCGPSAVIFSGAAPPVRHAALIK